MALDTFANLKTAIANHLERDDLTSEIIDFITLAESRHKNKIRFREMIKRSQASLTGRFLALPIDFLEAKTIRLLTNPVTVLEEVNLHQMNRVRRAATRTPAFFTVHEEFEFDVTPDTAKTAEIVYYAELAALSDSNASNALLARSPDAYLYGALVAAAPFVMDDRRIQTWDGLYKTAEGELSDADRRGQNIGPLVSSIVGPTP